MRGHKMKQPVGPRQSSTFCFLTRHYWNGLAGYLLGRLAPPPRVILCFSQLSPIP